MREFGGGLVFHREALGEAIQTNVDAMNEPLKVSVKF